MRNKILFLVVWIAASALRAQEMAVSLSSLFADSSRFRYSELPINSPQSDFGITAYDDGYVFSSSRESRMMVKYFNSDNAGLYDLFFFEKKDSFDYSRPRPFAKEIRSKQNEGPVSVAQSGTYMILTGNRTDAASENHPLSPLALFGSVREREEWSAPQVLPFCRPGWNYKHPALAPGDSVLFFSSDCPGGFGGMDLWITKRTANGWTEPVNAGAIVNSAYDELFPFASCPGTLFFSSNRPGGEGGLDIYAWAINDSDYVGPERLRGPINSASDDFSFWLDTDRTNGFFSSNRKGISSDDNIYAFRIAWPVVNRIDTFVAPQLCYTFFEQATQSTQDTVLMKYTWQFSDGSVFNGYEIYKCFDTTGDYAIHLEVRDSSAGDLVVSNIDYEFLVEPSSYVDFILPDSIGVHELFSADTRYSVISGYTIESACFDFGNGYRYTGRSAVHVYHAAGTYFPKVYFTIRNNETGVIENRCMVKRLTVI